MRISPRTTGAMVAVAITALAGCASGAGTSDNNARSTADVDVGDASAVTPVSDDVLAAAEREGSLLVYGNPNDEQMQPVIQAFEAANPGIKVRFLSLGGPSTFQRYESEKATGQATADLIIESDGRLWRDFVDSGEVEEYRDPNLDNLPEYADLLPGVAAVSMDPLVALFNDALIPDDQQPTSLEELAEISEQYEGKITTYDVESSLGYAGTYAYTSEQGEDGWAVLEKLGPNTVSEDNAGTMVTKILQGAYVGAFHMSGAVRALSATDQGEVLTFRYLTDDTPLVPRGMAITSAAAAPNAAKVFYNWLLSVDGQGATCEGGFTPYRNGVECAYGVPAIIAEVGDDAIMYGNYEPEIVDEQDALMSRFRESFVG